MYILDSNVFIEAKNRYYAFDICPGFWDWMDHITARGNVVSIDLVRKELADGRDELADWVDARKGDGWFLSVDDSETQKNFQQIALYLSTADYKDTAKAHFLSKADPWLIAKATTTGGVVVTHEVPANSKKRVPIPNICIQFGVRWMSTFDVLRDLEASFNFHSA